MVPVHRGEALEAQAERIVPLIIWHPSTMHITVWLLWSGCSGRVNNRQGLAWKIVICQERRMIEIKDINKTHITVYGAIYAKAFSYSGDFPFFQIARLHVPGQLWDREAYF